MFKKNMLSFIYDKDYCICNYKNKLYIYKYKKIINFNSKEFIIDVLEKQIIIKGLDLKINKLTREELLIEGKINKVFLEDKDENKSTN